jgi:hypothetical protein
MSHQQIGSDLSLSDTVEKARAALEVCRACDGQGEYEVQHQVTRDMATDAGEPEMEGMAISDREQCSECGGAGYIPDERVDALIAAVRQSSLLSTTREHEERLLRAPTTEPDTVADQRVHQPA